MKKKKEEKKWCSQGYSTNSVMIFLKYLGTPAKPKCPKLVPWGNLFS